MEQIVGKGICLGLSNFRTHLAMLVEAFVAPFELFRKTHLALNESNLSERATQFLLEDTEVVVHSDREREQNSCCNLVDLYYNS